MKAVRKLPAMKTVRQLLVCILLSLLSTPLWALPTDRAQAIHIESDSATRNDKTGITIYTGSVKIKQGSLNISADKVTVYSEANVVSKIVCLGKPAVYQQQPKVEDEIMTARANTIEYQLTKEIMVLTGDASVDQAGSTLKGPVINYDIKAEQMQASGEGRVQMVIPPSQQAESTR